MKEQENVASNYQEADTQRWTPEDIQRLRDEVLCPVCRARPSMAGAPCRECQKLAQRDVDNVFQTMPCMRCGKPTNFLGTKLCSGCWELDKRIPQNSEIAAAILRDCGYFVVPSVYRSAAPVPPPARSGKGLYPVKMTSNVKAFIAGLGWMMMESCLQADTGHDIRKVDQTELLDRALRDYLDPSPPVDDEFEDPEPAEKTIHPPN